jgi:hypothetical protein
MGSEEGAVSLHVYFQTLFPFPTLLFHSSLFFLSFHSIQDHDFHKPFISLTRDFESNDIEQGAKGRGR